jgi:hypothetical protein
VDPITKNAFQSKSVVAALVQLAKSVQTLANSSCLPEQEIEVSQFINGYYLTDFCTRLCNSHIFVPLNTVVVLTLDADMQILVMFLQMRFMLVPSLMKTKLN